MSRPPALYDRIGVGYDAARRPDPRIVDRLAFHLQPSAGGRYLDIACGTGNYTCAMAERGGAWFGVDVSERMLAEARRRSRAIDWRLGRAEQLPYDDAQFDGLLCTLSAHHFEDRLQAFREARRVLGGASFVLFCCTAERTMRYWLRRYFPTMFERIAAKEPSEAEMITALQEAGFIRVEREPFELSPDLQDHFLYCGKHRPELYFDPAIRAGISSFANLCDPEEVTEGLSRLRADLEAGRRPVPVAEADPPGDYVLLVASSV